MKTHFSAMLWYIVIGLLVVLFIFLWVIYVPERYWVGQKWAVWTFFTALLFGLVIHWYWRLRKSIKFWVLLCVLLVLHAAGYFLLLRHFERWPIMWYPLAMPVEAMLIAVVVKLTMNALPTLGRL